MTENVSGASRGGKELSAAERRLLTQLQTEFPLEERPFARLGEHIGLDEDDTLQMIKDLKGRRLIRRIGGIINTQGLGFASTLAAMKVPPERLEGVAAVVNAYPGVTHNYERNHAINLWFTLICPTEKALDDTLAEIQSRTGVEVLKMPTLQMFKLAVKLDLVGNGRAGERDHREESRPVPVETRELSAAAREVATIRPDQDPREALSPADKALLRQLQGDLPVVARPYRTLGEEAGLTEAEVLARIGVYLDRGWLRRLGAVLYHREAGFKANAMVGWDVPTDRVQEAGNLFASFPQVSHCYERPAYPPDWPYNVFTMVHGRNKEETESVIEDMAARTHLRHYKSLYSTREFKKTSMEYF